MTDLLRQEIAALATTIVVKVGTRVLTRDDGQLDPEQIQQLADQVHNVLSTGRKVVLVSSARSGPAWAASASPNGPPIWPISRPWLPSGQSILVEAYERSLHKHGRHAAQVLLNGRGPRTPHAIPERPEHAADAAGTRRRADHQRERHPSRSTNCKPRSATTTGWRPSSPT